MHRSLEVIFLFARLETEDTLFSHTYAFIANDHVAQSVELRQSVHRSLEVLFLFARLETEDRHYFSVNIATDL